jgi:3-oxoacyl-[acyl-carrier protein] reductase
MTGLPSCGIVTGAAGGIGKAVCLGLVEAGVDVLATDLDPTALDVLLEDAKGRAGRVIGLAADLTDPEAARALYRRALDSFAGIELLVHCSGFLKDARLQNMSEGLFQRLIEVNLLAPIRLTETVIPAMLEAGFGRIVTLASRAWLGNFGSAGYSCAKGGLVGYSRSRALALASHGITVNCIAPGFIDTPMAQSLPPHIKERVICSIPVGRAGMPDDVVRLVRFLASRDNGYVTGQTLVACGGRSIGDPILPNQKV